MKTLSNLQDKHPQPTAYTHMRPDDNQHKPLQVTEAHILQAIRSFPAGSSGGPDGLRPPHILELATCNEIGTDLVSSITAFTNLLHGGKCHDEVAPIIFSGSLIALTKKSGGIRLIAIGYAWRRLAAKCANTYAVAELADYFGPIQLRVGVPGGCKAAVHATRRFAEHMPDDQVIVKLDFINAFNSLHRDAMLEAISVRVSDIYKYCHLAYNQPSILKFFEHRIMSAEGPQQGDPLGGLLFCNTIHSLLRHMNSNLVEGYMDEITLGGKSNIVTEDVATIRTLGSTLGLHLNAKKCELIQRCPTSTESAYRDFLITSK